MTIEERAKAAVAAAEAEDDAAVASHLDACAAVMTDATSEDCLRVARVAVEVASTGSESLEAALELVKAVEELAVAWPVQRLKAARLTLMDLLNDAIVRGSRGPPVAHELRRVSNELTQMPTVKGAPEDFVPALSSLGSAASMLADASQEPAHAAEAIAARRNALQVLESEALPTHWNRPVHVAHAKLRLAQQLWRHRQLLSVDVEEVNQLAWDAAEQLDGQFASRQAMTLLAEVESESVQKPSRS